MPHPPTCRMWPNRDGRNREKREAKQKVATVVYAPGSHTSPERVLLIMAQRYGHGVYGKSHSFVPQRHDVDPVHETYYCTYKTSCYSMVASARIAAEHGLFNRIRQVAPHLT